MMSSLLVTGEGSSDMGNANNGQDICNAETYTIGPMAILTARLLEEKLPDWNRDNLDFRSPAQWITRISTSALARMAHGKQKFKPSKKLQKGFVEHAHRAWQMMEYAHKNEHQLVIYFHDADKEKQEHFVDAIDLGFNALESQTQPTPQGIAMVPKPTSEAWFICAVKDSPYQHCQALEEQLSGNDNASDQNAPKKGLARHLGEEATTEKQRQLAEEIDPSRINMPSFNQFNTDLSNAVRNLCGLLNAD